MDKNTLMSNIKLELKKLLTFAKEKFNNYTLSDGTNITCDKDNIEIGAQVHQIDDNGNQTTLDDGEYSIKDGITFTIKDGVVETVAGADKTQADVESPSEPNDATAAPQEQSKTKMTDDGQPEGQVEGDGEPDGDGAEPQDMEARLSDLEAKIEEIMNVLSQTTNKQNSVNEQMMGKLEKTFSKINKIEDPTSEAIVERTSGFDEYIPGKFSSETSNEALADLRKTMRELNRFSNIK
jgi:uncharacterized protein YukE